MLDTLEQSREVSGLELDYFRVRSQSESLIRTLSAEDCCVQSMPDVSPTKWHLAHTTWFFETFVLKPFVPNYHAFHPRYEYLFNSYYNGIGQQYPRPQRFLLTRPGLEEILHYRHEIDRRMEELLTGPAGGSPEIIKRVTLGLNHEQQHQELLLTDIKHVLWHNPLYPAYREQQMTLTPEVEPLAFINCTGGEFNFGHQSQGFHFDNETPCHRAFLRDYQLANRLISNSEFLAFIEDDGYRRPELWLSDGWAQVQEAHWGHPLYWLKQDQQWMEFTLSGLQPLYPSAPVCHLSYYEADAYARWAGARLPTELELEQVLKSASPAEGHFIERNQLHPLPATDSPQFFGDCWEWTQSAYQPYPGFKTCTGAIGEYNGKFMCNQMVLRGGSCLTPQDHIRASYRNFFYPHQRWQMMGLRLAREA